MVISCISKCFLLYILDPFWYEDESKSNEVAAYALWSNLRTIFFFMGWLVATEEKEKTLDNETAGPPKIIQYACRKMGIIFRIQSMNNGTLMDMKVWFSYKYTGLGYENEY